MVYFYVLIALIVLGIIYMSLEVRWLEIKTVRFTKNKKALKILQLSDIHISKLLVPAIKIRQAIEKVKPDLLIMTGDYIEEKAHITSFLNFLDTIHTGATTLMCFGNHDMEAFSDDPEGLGGFIKSIENKGISLLHNSSRSIVKNRKVYNLIGIADCRNNYHNFGKAFSGLKSSDATNIAFSHNPDIVLEIPENKVDYLLSGHFHGGQIWMPFNLEFLTLRKEKLCRQGIRRGLHKVNGINLYINRGLGNVCLPLRFMSRPEITVFHI
jgi:uncharacterized protein